MLMILEMPPFDYLTKPNGRLNAAGKIFNACKKTCGIAMKGIVAFDG